MYQKSITFHARRLHFANMRFAFLIEEIWLFIVVTWHCANFRDRAAVVVNDFYVILFGDVKCLGVHLL